MKMSKLNFKTISSFLFFFVCLLFVVLSPYRVNAQEAFTITNYTFDGTWHEDNTITVFEHLDVNFTSSRHGIYRSIPNYFKVGGEAFGRDEKVIYNVDIDDVWVYDNNFDLEYEDYYLGVVIGDEDVLVSGDQSYDISYTIKIPEDRTDILDFMYYSVLGPNWDTTIDNYSFYMEFDKPLSDEAVNNLNVLSGDGNEPGNALDVEYEVTADYVYGEAYDIKNYEAITFYTTMEDGYFVGAKSLTPAFPRILCGVLSVVIVFIFINILTGKRKKPVQSVQFYPPEGIGPSEVGVIIDESSDDIDIISLIPYWAGQGYISISEGKPGKIILHKLKHLPEDAPEYQLTFFNALFKKKDECNLKKLSSSFYENYISAQVELKYTFTDEKTLSKGRVKAYICSALLAIVFGLTISSNTRLAFLDDWPLGLFGGAAILALGVVTTIMETQFYFKKKGMLKFILFAIAMGVLAFGNTLLCTGNSMDYFLPRHYMFCIFGAAFVAALFMGKMITPTDYKIDMIGKLLGLREFIRVAEKDRLAMLLDENPSYFYDILPYAMVFGMADKWAEKFKDLTVPKPDWYTSTHTTDFSTIMMAHMLSDVTRSNINSSISSLASSGSSSGGGFSSGGFSVGGGAGGGGGGSW